MDAAQMEAFDEDLFNEVCQLGIDRIPALIVLVS